jgi:cation-transporting P-type ATPase E
VRLVIALTVLMSGAILAQAALEGFSLLRVVQTTAVLSGLVPYGLFFLIAVAYTAGASRIAERGALVQQVNAVESVAEVDVVCTDKTGTLTTGRLTLSDVEPVAGRDPTPLGAFARSVTTPNLTTVALAGALPGVRWTVRDEVPFSSSLRWSGFVTDDGTWVLGAPDALAPHLTGPSLAGPSLAGPSLAGPSLDSPSLARQRSGCAHGARSAGAGLRPRRGAVGRAAQLGRAAGVARAGAGRGRRPRRRTAPEVAETIAGSGGTGSI